MANILSSAGQSDSLPASIYIFRQYSKILIGYTADDHILNHRHPISIIQLRVCYQILLIRLHRFRCVGQATVDARKRPLERLVQRQSIWADLRHGSTARLLNSIRQVDIWRGNSLEVVAALVVRIVEVRAS